MGKDKKKKAEKEKETFVMANIHVEDMDDEPSEESPPLLDSPTGEENRLLDTLSFGSGSSPMTSFSERRDKKSPSDRAESSSSKSPLERSFLPSTSGGGSPMTPPRDSSTTPTGKSKFKPLNSIKNLFSSRRSSDSPEPSTSREENEAEKEKKREEKAKKKAEKEKRKKEKREAKKEESRKEREAWFYEEYDKDKEYDGPTIDSEVGIPIDELSDDDIAKSLPRDDAF